MEDPKPLRLDPNDGLGRLIEEVRTLPPRTAGEEAAQWGEVEHRALGTRPGPAWRWLVAPVALATAAAAAWFAMPRPSELPAWREVATNAVGKVEVAADAVVEASSPTPAQPVYELSLSTGALRAQDLRLEKGQTLSVTTPHVRVVVVGTSFDVEVTRERTSVAVSKGVVRVTARNGRSVEVKAGERVVSDDARLLALAPVPSPAAAQSGMPTIGTVQPGAVLTEPGSAPGNGGAAAAGRAQVVADCAKEPAVDAKRACYLRFSAGEGLQAQNALYAVALLERDAGRTAQAIEYWTMFERRFPDGALAPEVAAMLLRELVAERRSAEALAVVRSFEERFGTDPRAPEVALAKANLLCDAGGELAAAIQAYERAALSANAKVRDDALHYMAACEAAHGDRRRAKLLRERYLREFPEGTHRGEVGESLGR